MSKKLAQIEGMKTKPAGGADRAPFGKNLMPTNIRKTMSGLRSMLSAIKHVGRPSKGSKLPFA